MFDPTATLWPASYKGVPFRVEQDSIDDGRRLAVHQFPHIDDPFVEDMGRKAGSFEITAYVVGEAATAQSGSLKALALRKGAGPLVLPLDGVIQAHLQDVKRAFAKDKLGYVAFTLTFVREGAKAALVSVSSLAQLVFDAADAAVSALAGFALRIETAGAPSIVGEAGASELSALPVALESARVAAPVDPEVSRALFLSLADRLAAAPAARDALDGEWFVAAAQDVRDLADAIEPVAADRALVDVAAGFPALATGGLYTGPTINLRAAANVSEARRFSRAAVMIARAESMARRTFADRPAAMAARTAILAAFAAELDAAAEQRDDDTYAALGLARGALADWFAETIVDLKPIVLARLPGHMPAHVVAWRLYGAVDRVDDLVSRNRVKHPGYLPTTIEAVAP